MTKRTVLIIEDDTTLQELYTKVIEDAGIHTLSATTGKDGLHIALTKHPDVLLVDVMLPDISGHEVVKQLRLDPWGKKAVVVYLTNRTDAESVVTAIEQGSDEYIVKAHTSNHELLNKLRSAMLG